MRVSQLQTKEWQGLLATGETSFEYVASKDFPGNKIPKRN